MIRIFSLRSVYHTTKSLPSADNPMSNHRSSSSEWSGSETVIAKGSLKIVLASSNTTPCFASFRLAFSFFVPFEYKIHDSVSLECRTTRITGRRRLTQPLATSLDSPLPFILYARHGRELVGCKSPVRKRELNGGQDTKCKPLNLSTRRRQLRKGDQPWGGSLRILDR